MDVRQVRAGDREPHRFGAGREQQPVVRDHAAVGECHRVVFRIDRRDVDLQAQIDMVVAVKVIRPQRQPVLRRAAGEIVLRKVRAVDWRRIVVAQHHDAALIILPPQHLGGSESGRAAADDHDPVRHV